MSVGVELNASEICESHELVLVARSSVSASIDNTVLSFCTRPELPMKEVEDREGGNWN